MKKGLLKTVAGLMVSCMLVLSVGAIDVERAREKTFTFEYGQREIIVTGVLEEQQARRVADCIVGEKEETSTRNILCTLLGHSMVQATANDIFHRYFTTAPRCLRITYRVDSCTRCGYSVKTEISRTAIFCCS